MMHPDERPDTTAGDPEIRLGESAISSLLAHYFQFEETLGMNTARGAARTDTMKDYNTSSISQPSHSIAKEPASITDSPKMEVEREKFILVAMPAFNEEATIAKVILRTRKIVKNILVIDDGSTDATAEIAEALGAIVIRHPENKGYGGALQTIFSTAKKFDADILVILDSDGQHDPNEIPSLLKPIHEGIDIAIGSRFIGKNGNHIPTYRVLGMKILDSATKFAADMDITDSQSGFRAYGKKAISTICISGNGMSAGSEILIHAKDHNLSIAQVPITVNYNVEKPSTHNPLSHGLDVLSHIIGIVGYRRPLITFGVPGGIMSLLAIAVLVYTLTELYMGGSFHSIMFVGGITLLILGLLLVTTSLILNSLVQVVKMGKA